MQVILPIMTLIYIAALIALLPVLAYILWEIAFNPQVSNSAAAGIAIRITIGLIGGHFLIKYFSSKNSNAMSQKIRSIAPPGFNPQFELHDYGRYIGIAPQDNVMVIVDTKNSIVRRESMEFYQGYFVEEDGRTTTVTIRFNNFDFSSIKFSIPRKKKDDIIAKLNYAMQF